MNAKAKILRILFVGFVFCLGATACAPTPAQVMPTAERVLRLPTSNSAPAQTGAEKTPAAESASSPNAEQPWSLVIQAERPDSFTTGDPFIIRSEAEKQLVLGQFGCGTKDPYPGVSGKAVYTVPGVPAAEHLILVIRYSKNSDSTVPIEIFLDQESSPRATFTPVNQYDWNRFAETELDLGSVAGGDHALTLSTTGQQYGVADLDRFLLSIH